MREEGQTRLGCRDGEVIPHHMDMDLDNNMVHEQLEDYEGSEHGDTLGRKEVDNKHGGCGTDVTEGPHEVTGRTTPGADDKGASAMDNDDGRTGHGIDNGPFDEGPPDSKSSAGDMHLLVRMQVPVSAMGLLIGARGAMLGTMAALKGCSDIVSTGAHGDSDRALIVSVPDMQVASDIKDLIKDPVRAYRPQSDEGVKAV